MPYRTPAVEVIRSARRTRTVQARLVGDTVEVRIPGRMSAAEEEKAVAEILAKLRAKSVTSATSDEELVARAQALNERYLDGQARVGSIRWVGNQTTRWGSCTPSTGAIRITDRLQKVPDYVLDAVILHELVHTFIPGHGPRFWEWADRAPQAERAKGYLEAYQRFG
ncbi:MAG: M48 family metallopeptidase [Corynebacterium sp.]|uniref:M48 metallopeptidase family protein n=1 Tax=Corynebacterium sp. TaxID=1720 RepID=UPI0026DEAB2D|nr:M48 family metallopeptidase [Corynebacterium sp.]MDO5670833.1 M48 family metallopeptidase [Corynebacterium sp.]